MAETGFEVKITKGPAKGKKHPVKKEALVFGSDESADVVLEAPGVEPRHAQIVFQGGQVMLEDLGTKSGTFRNGLRLLGPVQVFPGDRIGLGPKVVLTLEGEDPRGGAKEGGLAESVGKAIDQLAEDLGISGEEKTGDSALDHPAAN